MRGVLFASLYVVFAQFATAEENPKTAITEPIAVSTAVPWLDTGLDVAAGESIRLTADGTLTYPKAKSPATPAGLKRDWRDLVRNYPVNSAGQGALIGRIGNAETIRPFLVGAKWEGLAPLTGRLFLGINQPGSETAEGQFLVRFERLAPPPATPLPSELELPEFPQEKLDEIPLRVGDLNNTPGDRVNFILVGSEKRVTEALQAAGWSIVDKDVQGAIVNSILNSLSKQAYVTMPMSVLYLFGRGQDYGYAQGDPVTVVAQRHHFRLWKAPFELEGQTVWAGAGTHDVGFDKDQRDGKVTHRIDPEVDKEREHIVETLSHTGTVVKTTYMTPKDAIKGAKTAHGQEFRSDGRTVIVYLRP